MNKLFLSNRFDFLINSGEFDHPNGMEANGFDCESGKSEMVFNSKWTKGDGEWTAK
jgi:hypothetical protein